MTLEGVQRITDEAMTLSDDKEQLVINYIVRLRESESVNKTNKREAFEKFRKFMGTVDVADDYREEKDAYLREKYGSFN